MLKIKATAAKAFKKDFRAVMKAAMQDAVKSWHKFTLPGHFKTGAETKYGYARRSDKPAKNGRRKGYAEKKRRKGLPPLVWSGLGRAMLTNKITVSGTAKSATGSMDAPFYMANKMPGKPDMAAEVTAVTREEEQAMADLIAKNVAGTMNDLRGEQAILDNMWQPEFQVA